jgi:hypothetical protein
MENTPVPPNQKPPTPPVPSSDVPGLPAGTFEYVEETKKRSWKRIIEIAAVVVVAVIPIVISLFKPEYSLTRSYAILNPASYVNGQSSQTWGNFVTTAKKFIQPQSETKTTTEISNQGNVPGGENNPAGTDNNPTVVPTQPSQEVIYPTLSQDQIEYIIYNEREREDGINYSTQPDPTASPTKIPPPTKTPTPTPTKTPTPTPSSNEGSNSQSNPTATPTPSSSSPYVACEGKKKDDNCSYTSYGHKIDGRCKPTYNNKLICVGY